jgi:hypothetical protein
MKKLQSNIRTPQGQARLQDAPHELLDEIGRARDEPAVVGQPFADRRQPVA